MRIFYRDLISGATVFALLTTLSCPSFADESESHIGKGVEALPLFDAHVHYKEPAWAPYPPATVVELMDKSGVAMALVSSTPDEGTIKLWRYEPNRVVPELRPYHGQAGSSNWTKAPDMFDYLVKRLNEYPHEGIGEFHLHNVDPGDELLLRKIAELAKSKNIYIHVHSGKEPVDLLFSFEPKLKIIWAHAGMPEPAQTVGKMMATYETLYADTSFREGDILTPQGTIDPTWRLVLERFPDRFMVGSDTWVNEQWDRYGQIMAINRRWLRVRPETLCRITEFSEHESNGRELDEGERVAVEVLPVLGQSAAAVEPGDGAFDHPTPGLDDEALHPIGSLDDLGLEIGQDAGQGAVKDRPLIGAVGEQFPEKGKQTEQGRQQRETAVAILNVGGGDDAVQQQALRIDQNMPLLALDQLAGIEAVAVDASPPFSALFTL